MMDYEKASMNAVHEQFPHVSLRGCWFHYCQAVLKKWKRLGLLKAPRKIVSMAMTLALAPSEMFAEGLNLMQTIADEESDNYPNILLFMKYMRNTWLPISKKTSVYGCPIRTNNLVESFHSIMLKKMHTVHPNFWTFLDNFSKLIMDQEINYNRLVNGLQLTRDRNPFNEYKNKKIEKAQYYLSRGICSLEEFLQLFSEENLRKQHKIALLIDDDNEIEICADLYKEGDVDADTKKEYQQCQVIIQKVDIQAETKRKQKRKPLFTIKRMLK
ncbi:uncharacterized protein [Linepithema humile]|uniref:uncharacterized protein n=1 Tax=Linepithema humile TaxID=83485 RepID=UPI00351E438D